MASARTSYDHLCFINIWIRVVILRCPFPGCLFPGHPGFQTFFHSRIPVNGNGQFPYKRGMLLQCKFQYDITQTVRLANGSGTRGVWCAECANQSPPTAGRCPMLSQPHTFTLAFISSRLLRLQVVTTGRRRCPRAHHTFFSAGTQHSAVSSVQCHCYLRVVSDQWRAAAAHASRLCGPLLYRLQLHTLGLLLFLLLWLWKCA